MKFKITSESKDYIMHIDNFIIENNNCEAIYDYDNDTIKQPDRKVLSPAGIMLIIILIVIIIVAIISRKKQNQNT